MKLNPYEIQNISKKIFKIFGEIPFEALAAIETWSHVPQQLATKRFAFFSIFKYS